MSVNIVELKKDDVIIITIDIGHLAPSRAVEYCSTIKKSIEEAFPNNKILIKTEKSHIDIISKSW